MRIGTWNVNGIRARQAQVAEWLEREHLDVICLQELKATEEQIPENLCRLSDYWCYWHGAKAYSGVALLVSKQIAPERPEFSHPAFDHESRIVVAKLPETASTSAISIASVYVPNGGKNLEAKINFLEAMAAFAETFRATHTPLIICGDMNVARTEMDIHPKERKPDTIGQLPEERTLFENILGKGLQDIQRVITPDDPNVFTWWAPWRNMRQRNIGWRIDYILASETITPFTCTSFREFGTSDHAPIIADLVIETTS